MEATYPLNIPSIRSRHPELPPIVGNVDIYLDESIIVGNEILPEHVANARYAADILRGKYYRHEEPLLTEAVVQTAEFRATAIEAFHARRAYPLQGDQQQILQAIQSLGDRITTLTTRLDTNTTRLDTNTKQVKLAKIETANLGIRLQNRLVRPQQYVAVQKTVEGSGLALAQAVATSNPLRNMIATHAEANEPAVVGETPGFYNAGEIDELNQGDILKLIWFYNESIGITHGENGILQRRRAVREFFQQV